MNTNPFGETTEPADQNTQAPKTTDKDPFDEIAELLDSISIGLEALQESLTQPIPQAIETLEQAKRKRSNLERSNQ